MTSIKIVAESGNNSRLLIPVDDLQPSPNSLAVRKIAEAARVFIDVITRETQEKHIAHDFKTRSGIDGLRMAEYLTNEAQGLVNILHWVESAIQHQVQAILQRWNSYSLIHHLPFELLADIFEITIMADSRPSLARHRIACVATSWTAIVKNSPNLWAFICPTDPIHLLKESLSNSKHYPLEVFAPERALLRTPMVDFLRLVIPHANRWKSAKIDLSESSDFPMIQQLSSAAAPALKTLHISQSFKRYPDEAEGLPVVDLFKGGAENLTDFRLENVRIPWGSSFLSGLRTLSLQKFSVRSGLSAHQILRYLIASPQLEHLEIRSIGTGVETRFDAVEGGGGDEEEIADPSFIHMLHLQTLQLERCPRRIITAIISHVRAPILRTFELFHNIDSDNPGRLLWDVKDFLPKLAPLIEDVIRNSSHKPQISFSPDHQIILEHAHDGQKFAVRVPLYAYKDLTSWMTLIYGNGSSSDGVGVKIVYDTYIEYRTNGPIFQFLAELPACSLYVDSRTQHGYLLLGFLSSSCDADDEGVVRWVWPNLTQLTFTGKCTGYRGVAAMLTSRYGESGGGEALGDGIREERPKSLEVLHLETIGNAEVLATIKSIIGNCKLSYTEKPDSLTRIKKARKSTFNTSDGTSHVE